MIAAKGEKITHHILNYGIHKLFNRKVTQSLSQSFTKFS